MPPRAGEWHFSINGSGTRVDNEHMAMSTGTMYWHVLDVTLTETAAVGAVGLWEGAGLEIVAPWRTVTTRVRFEDEQRRPFVPEEGDLHHRNETIAGLGDPWLLLHLARPAGAWTLASRLGVSVPLGRTEPNPFDLGRRGLAHQHVQLGTGTWDPLIGLGAGRRLGSVGLTLQGLARLGWSENDHGLQPGHRYQAGLTFDRGLGRTWRASTGLELMREEPERWGGRIEEDEGNIGRTDLLLALGLQRSLGGSGLSLAVRVPLLTRTRGAQLDYPVIVSIGLSR